MALFTKRRKITEAYSTAKQARDEHQRTQAELDQLKAKHERLRTVMLSMWKLLKTKVELDDEQLVQEVKELEKQLREDAPPGNCVSCARPIHSTKRKCIFCGAEQPGTDILNTLF